MLLNLLHLLVVLLVLGLGGELLDLLANLIGFLVELGELLVGLGLHALLVVVVAALVLLHVGDCEAVDLNALFDGALAVQLVDTVLDAGEATVQAQKWHYQNEPQEDLAGNASPLLPATVVSVVFSVLLAVVIVTVLLVVVVVIVLLVMMVVTVTITMMVSTVTSTKVSVSWLIQEDNRVIILDFLNWLFNLWGLLELRLSLVTWLVMVVTVVVLMHVAHFPLKLRELPHLNNTANGGKHDAAPDFPDRSPVLALVLESHLS